MSRLRISEKTAFSTRIEKHVLFRLFFLSLSKQRFDHMFLGVFCITFSKFHLLLILLFFGFFKNSTGIRFQNIELHMPPLCMSVTNMILNSKCNLVSRKIEIFTILKTNLSNCFTICTSEANAYKYCFFFD